MPEPSEATGYTYRDALRMAVREVLQHEPKAFLLGEDVGRYGGAFAVSKGLLGEFGPDRIMDVPLSEAAFTGAGIGAALGGMRPIVEIMTVNFSLLALDQIVNNAATLCHMTNGQCPVPLVIRMSCGIGKQLAAQHSHSWEPLYAHIPGLLVCSAASHYDARFMLPAALKENDPVILMEYTSLLNTTDTAPLPEQLPDDFRLRGARVCRTGTDVTLISYGAALHRCLSAADALLKEGLSVEVIDLRVLRPLDTDTLVKSTSKTHRALVVEDAWQSYGIGAEVASRIGALAFYELDAPVQRLGGREVPIPYPLHLEEACVPQAEVIAEKIRALVRPVISKNG